MYNTLPVMASTHALLNTTASVSALAGIVNVHGFVVGLLEHTPPVQLLNVLLPVGVAVIVIEFPGA